LGLKNSSSLGKLPAVDLSLISRNITHVYLILSPDLERVTDYAEEKEISAANISSVSTYYINIIIQRIIQTFIFIYRPWNSLATSETRRTSCE